MVPMLHWKISWGRLCRRYFAFRHSESVVQSVRLSAIHDLTALGSGDCSSPKRNTHVSVTLSFEMGRIFFVHIDLPPRHGVGPRVMLYPFISRIHPVRFP